jgi:hypothetical protein
MIAVIDETAETLRVPPLGSATASCGSLSRHHWHNLFLVSDVDAFHLCWNTRMEDGPNEYSYRCRAKGKHGKPMLEAVFYDRNCHFALRN